MKYVLGIAAMVLATVAVRAEEKKFDAEKLLGNWEYVSGEKNGEKVDIDKLKGQKVVITKDKFTLDGPEKFVMSYEIDGKASPTVIKLKILESPFGAGATAEGIIEVKGDEMKFCYAPMGKGPTKFEAKEGSMMHNFVLKRAKK